MKEKKKLLNEEEREEILRREQQIYDEISALKPGKAVRAYIRANRKILKDYDVRVSFLKKYPHSHLVVSCAALAISILALIIRIMQ